MSVWASLTFVLLAAIWLILARSAWRRDREIERRWRELDARLARVVERERRARGRLS